MWHGWTIKRLSSSSAYLEKSRSYAPLTLLQHTDVALRVPAMLYYGSGTLKTVAEALHALISDACRVFHTAQQVVDLVLPSRQAGAGSRQDGAGSRWRVIF